MILWLLGKRQRRYFYLIFVVIALDLIIGSKIVDWQMEILKEVIEE